MAHQITLRLPENVYLPLAEKAKANGLTIEAAAQACLAEAIASSQLAHAADNEKRESDGRQRTKTNIDKLQAQAWETFSGDLKNLLDECPGKWVGYHGTTRIATADSSAAVLREAERQGFPQEELFIEMVIASAAEEEFVFLPPVVD